MAPILLISIWADICTCNTQTERDIETQTHTHTKTSNNNKISSSSVHKLISEPNNCCLVLINVLMRIILKKNYLYQKPVFGNKI